mgnify:CR=1 FL=1|tara:strand:- start:152 stop:472 length:321 start_codon:yes stop_codon:yes gene_type:complete
MTKKENAKTENFKEVVEDKEIELKIKAEKVSDEHLKQMQNVVNAVSQLQFNIGKIEAQKHTLLHNLSITQDRISVLQDTLMKEYGSFDVNLETGAINWPKEENDEK